jgi:hypothetical protein
MIRMNSRDSFSARGDMLAVFLSERIKTKDALLRALRGVDLERIKKSGITDKKNMFFFGSCILIQN